MHAILNSLVETSQSLSTNEENSKLQVRIHGVDGSLATFTQDLGGHGGWATATGSDSGGAFETHLFYP